MFGCVTLWPIRFMLINNQLVVLSVQIMLNTDLNPFSRGGGYCPVKHKKYPNSPRGRILRKTHECVLLFELEEMPSQLRSEFPPCFSIFSFVVFRSHHLRLRHSCKCFWFFSLFSDCVKSMLIPFLALLHWPPVKWRPLPI